MATPGNFVAGTALTAADMNLLPGGMVGYVAKGSSQGSITTEADISGLTLTWTAVTDRLYRTTAFTAGILSTVAGDNMIVKITDGSNVLKGCRGSVTAAAATQGLTVIAVAIETGLSGSTTRKVRCLRNSGTGTLTFEAPSFLLVEDLGIA